MGRTSSIVKDRYNAKAYDEIKVRVDKGHKVEIQAHAAALGESLNGFIGRAIDDAMERDGSGNRAKAHGVVQDSVGVSLVPDTLETAQKAAEATGDPGAIYGASCGYSDGAGSQFPAPGYQSGSRGQTGKGGVILWHYQRRT